VKKVFPTYRTDLPLCEEPRDRNRSHTFLHNPAVVMGLPEEAFASPAATEQQRA
jgi:hypothetical protein